MKGINQQLQSKITQLEQKEAVIREQEEFLRIIYDNVREAIFIVDIMDGVDEARFVYREFNPAAHQLTGIAVVANKTPAEIFPPADAAKIDQHYRQCLKLGSVVTYEECLPVGGKDSWWITTLNPIKDDRGKVVQIIGTSLNISDRRQAEIELEQERRFLMALLDNLTDGVVACDRQGTLTMFNRAGQDFFETPLMPYPPEEWASRYHLYDASGQRPLQPQEIPLFRAFSGESVRDIEIMTIPPHAQPRTLLVNGSPIIDTQGQKLGAVVAVRDISKQKAAEQEVIKLNAELESKVLQRTAQLEQLNLMLLNTTSQLEQRNQELDQFAYVTSHDLKAPLRAISNLSQWIEEDLADSLDDDNRYNMALLRRRVRRLENLIDGLLDYSRIGRSSYESQLVNVSDLLQEIIETADLPPSSKITIAAPMPTLVTQLVPLQQVFNNLIANAIRHGSSDNTQITLSVQELDDWYQFSVSDNGKGIDPQYHERIFTIFQTLESQDKNESTGIGLSIVKKAVENQGGTIKIESQPNAGTTFKFTWKKL